VRSPEESSIPQSVSIIQFSRFPSLPTPSTSQLLFSLPTFTVVRFMSSLWESCQDHSAPDLGTVWPDFDLSTGLRFNLTLREEFHSARVEWETDHFCTLIRSSVWTDGLEVAWERAGGLRVTYHSWPCRTSSCGGTGSELIIKNELTANCIRGRVQWIGIGGQIKPRQKQCFRSWTET
jgi:hypothetical protein